MIAVQRMISYKIREAIGWTVYCIALRSSNWKFPQGRCCYFANSSALGHVSVMYKSGCDSCAQKQENTNKVQLGLKFYWHLFYQWLF